MKSFALLSLIPLALAYRGKPRHATPKINPIKDDYVPLESELLWHRYGTASKEDLHKSGFWGYGFENRADDGAVSGADDGSDYLVNSLGGDKPRKALSKPFPVEDDGSIESKIPVKVPKFESELYGASKPLKDMTRSVSSNVDFIGDEAEGLSPNYYLNVSDDDSDLPSLKVTVPLEQKGEYGVSSGIFPTQKILYQLGTKVLTDDVAIYFIYYGNWNVEQKRLLNDFTGSLGDSTWWNIMRKYYSQEDENSERIYVNGTLKLEKSIDDNYSMGRSLANGDIPLLIRTHVEDGFLPKDSTGVYFVLTSDDVEETIGGARMCDDYCGYHLTGTFSDDDTFYYAVAGRPAKCVLNCAGPNSRSSPNDDPATDAMVSIIAHELAEAVSDPDDESLYTRAWNDANYFENGDMCSYKYGMIQRVFTEAKRSSFYNYESASGTKFLVQQNWDPELQKCVSTA